MLKHNEMRQNQLLRILDIVPDSVYISTPENEGLYANLKMNEFFGRDIIALNSKKREIPKLGEKR